MDIQKLADPHEFPNIGHDETRWLAEDSTKAVQLAREALDATGQD